MISGAREAAPSLFRRLLARAAARQLTALVVPGPEVARARGMDANAAGWVVVETPRHASVLVLVGEPPDGLKKAAAVLYAQMPRPRAVLAVGAGDVWPLPEPDVAVGLGQESLARGVDELRRSFAEGAFGTGSADFDAAAVRTRTEYVCPMHPEVVREEPGSCPQCGMDLVPREAGEGGEEPGDADHDHAMHEGMDHSVHGHDPQHDAADSGHGQMAHGHGDMGHGDMDFMSMVEMTKDLPRSSDGLQMEWVEAPFGPFFPGLPGGLSLTLTLDGDTVAEAVAEPAIEGRVPAGGLAGPVEGFAQRLALLDPLSPVAYRMLALRALEEACGVTSDEQRALERVGAVERERAASHLGWLASFARLMGYGWLERRAGELQIALLRAARLEEFARLAEKANGLARRVGRTPLLQHKLGAVGNLPPNTRRFGPVARAAGSASDARTGEEAYRTLGFEPVVREGDDALSRLWVRLAEVERSLELVRETGSVSLPEGEPGGSISGRATATIETPRGTATLRLSVQGEEVVSAELDTPSTRHLGLIGPVCEQRELADALAGVASLDLSPWEVFA